MLGAALAALAQDDLKRLLAWSTISQVAVMLAGVAVARTTNAAAPAVLHLLSHAAFKALLFLVAGCVAQFVGSTLLADMGGLRWTQPWLAALMAVGLAALAGLPPLSGFWSKEAVLSAAEGASTTVGWPATLVLVSGLLTTLVTGAYTGRVLAVVVLGDPPPPDADTLVPADGQAHPEGRTSVLPAAMNWPLWILAVPAALLGLVLLHPPDAVRDVHIDLVTAVAGAALSVVGVTWGAAAAQTRPERDAVLALPGAVRAFLRDGYRLDDVQRTLVVRPYAVLTRLVRAGDRDVLDGYVRAVPVLARWGSALLARAQSGLATGYLAWLAAGAVVVGLLGVVLS
jgi:NADH-quinone oxidoreductase subunit L